MCEYLYAWVLVPSSTSCPLSYCLPPFLSISISASLISVFEFHTYQSAEEASGLASCNLGRNVNLFHSDGFKCCVCALHDWYTQEVY